MHEKHHHHHHAHHMGEFAAEMDRRYPELYHRMMPYIEEAHMRHPDIHQMDERTLDHLAWKVVQESGLLHDMPEGHSEETARDLSKIMLLTHGPMEAAAEAMSPIVPLIWSLDGPFFFHPFFPFFPGHRRHFRHHHHRHGGHRGPRRGGRR